MRTREVIIAEPHRVVVAEGNAAPPGEGQFRARGLVSAISRGTERRFFEGSTPFETHDFDVPHRLFRPAGSRELYPLRPGYQWVGEVEAVGPGIAGFEVGNRVFALAPHAERHILAANDPGVWIVPPDIAPHAVTWLVLTEVAVNAVHDAQPLLGERVLVIGLGVLGILVVRLLRKCGLEVIAAGRSRTGLGRAERSGAVVVDARAVDIAEWVKETGAGVDVALETAGTAAGLAAAIRSVAVRGRVVSVGFYGAEDVPLPLGREWHHNAVEMVSSRYDWGCATAQARWPVERLRAEALRQIREGVTDDLVTGRFSIADAERVYRRLGEDEMLGTIFVYGEDGQGERGEA